MVWWEAHFTAARAAEPARDCKAGRAAKGSRGKSEDACGLLSCCVPTAPFRNEGRPF